MRYSRQKYVLYSIYIYLVHILCVMQMCRAIFHACPCWLPNRCNPFACHVNSTNQETVAMSQSKQLSELKLSMQLHMSSYYSQHLSVCTHSVSVDLLTSCPWMAAICNRQRLQQQRTKFGMCRAEQFGLDTQRGRRRDKAVANWAESGSGRQVKDAATLPRSLLQLSALSSGLVYS